MKISRKGSAAFGVVAGVTLLASPVESSQAAVVSETEAFIFSGDAPVFGFFPLNFNRFNPAAGTLTAVNFTLETDVTAEATVFVTSGPGGASGTTQIVANFSVQVNTPSLGTIFGPVARLAAAECSTSSETGSTCNDDGNSGSAFDGTFMVPGGSVGSFAGAGSFNAEMNFLSTLEDFCAGEGASCEHSGTIGWEGTLTIEYTFTPPAAAAPEPDTLILVGAGLGALGLASRRRKLAIGS
jgi:hypothetical protein